MECYQKYTTACAFSGAYASIALAVVLISLCFTLGLSRKLQKHLFIEVHGTFLNSSCS